MMNRPLLLDAFCGAGGAAMGYHRASFEVVGVDIAPQPRYPFEFHQSDALEFIQQYGKAFDAIHASPPCQRWTNAQKIRNRDHPDFITPLRQLLISSDKPWIIENVKGAPLHSPIILCGCMFDDLRVYRERLFEPAIVIPQLAHNPHHATLAKMGRPVREGEFMHVVGNFSDVTTARKAMGIDWMARDELKEAIPPAYTEYVGRFLMKTVITTTHR